MGHRMRFRLNWEKAIETLVWVANERQGVDFFHIVKILYYADKQHLQKYARPILGDTYIKMEHGPVPSGIYDLLKKNPFLDPETLSAIAKGITVDMEGDVPRVMALREPNLDVFSGTDLTCLRESVEKYANMSVSKLRRLTHQERAWVEASPHGEMDYELMIDPDLPNREDLLADIRESAAYVVV